VAVTTDPVAEAAEAALAGLLVVFPTDTVYGIATRPDRPAATARLFEAKDREPGLALPVLVPSIDLAREVARLDRRAERLAEAFWPGALTLILPRSDASAAWHLGGDGVTVGVRIPDHPLAGVVLHAAGPLAASSANRSRRSPRHVRGPRGRVPVRGRAVGGRGLDGPRSGARSPDPAA
jgi:L-threonylcarbamoyladenylate synthase